MVLMDAADVPLAAIREQLVSALDLVVHMARRADGSRRVVAVAEVVNTPERVRMAVDER